MIDLHAHSYYSDGTCSPAFLVEEGLRLGLDAVALCDHNTVAGLPEFLEAAAGKPIEAVPGVEFTTEYMETELHILALLVKPQYYGQITRNMEAFMQRKEQSNRALLQALRQVGLDLDYDTIKNATSGEINRANIAAEMIRKGYADSVQDAFRQYLSVKRGFYKPPVRPDALETVAWIRQMGAVAVLAHPFLNMNEAQLRQFLPKAISQGLNAMETMYAKYAQATTDTATRLAKEFALLPSGGSDFHGENKPDIALGTGRGNLEIPTIFLEKLRRKKV